MNITESRLPQDGAIKTYLTKLIWTYVYLLYLLLMGKIVIRILNYTMSSAGLENLGLSEKSS